MSGFDRIKPPEARLLHRREGSRVEPDEADPAGRATLFSAGPVPAGAPAAGGLALTCSRCGASSPLDAATALRSAFPLFLLAPWKRHPVFAVCPACRHRAWLRVGKGEAPAS